MNVSVYEPGFVHVDIKYLPQMPDEIDNGSQFTDRFTAKRKTPSGQHAFDQQCTAFAIEHRLSPPRHPQTNGMAERFNGRVAEVIKQTRFKSAGELQSTLRSYTATYNHRIPRRALNHLSPI